MIPPLVSYLTEHSAQVARSKGQADVIFFGVKALEGASPEGLRAAIETHEGDSCDVDPFDGREHSYLELGAWLGDQGLALRLIGLGSILGLWRLLTPRTLMPGLSEEKVQSIAGCGWVGLTTKPGPIAATPRLIAALSGGAP